MRRFFTLIILLLSTTIIISQSIWTNPIDGTNPNTSNPYETGQTVNSNITVSGIGRGDSIVPNNANDRYNANSWNTASIDLNAYFYFVLSPNSGYKLNLSNFVYMGQRSGSGPNSFAFRSSVDGFVSDIGGPTATGATIDLSSSSYQNITGAIEFRLYGWGATGSAGTFSVNEFTFNGAVALPVTFSDINAVNRDNKSLITWTTASETNNSHFTIERSADARDFESIGEIKGAGNSSRELSYEFIDENPLPGINYYRIKQTDYDGKFSYSEIGSVRHKGLSHVSVTPRTTEGRLDIVTDLDDYTLAIYNAAGQEVKRLIDMSLDQSISIDALHSGIYFVRIYSGSHSETVRIVKM